MADEIIYKLNVDDQGTPKLKKFGAAAEDAGKKSSKAMKGASEGFQELGSRIPGVGSAMSGLAMGPAAAAGAAIGALAVGFGTVVMNAIDMADSMNDLSLRLGVSTEQLSVLSLYAEQSGTDIETLATGMGKLGVKLSEGDKKLAAYGITAGSVDEALFQLADKVAATEDPMLRLKIATDAFGKSGQQMLPLLVQGGDALREMSDAAPIVSTEMAKMADEFNDKMAALRGRFTGIGLAIAESVLPQMEIWLDGVDRIRKAMGLLSDEEEYQQKRLEKRNKIIADYSKVLEERKKGEALIGKVNGAVEIDGMTMREALAAFDRNNPQDRPQAPPKPAPKGKFGAGGDITKPGKPEANSVDFFAASGIDEANVRFRYNQSRALAPEAQPEGENVELGPDWYAGIPLSDKAKESLAKQEDEDAQRRQEIMESQAAQSAAFFDSIRNDMTGSFASAYRDIFQGGRDVAASLYDAFSEMFTTRLIDSLANITTNLLMMGAPGGPAAGSGLLGLLGFASGGTPPTGSPSLVGERRAEVFVPRGPGRIEPTAGAGNTYNITVSNPAEARSTLRAIQRDERKRDRGIR